LDFSLNILANIDKSRVEAFSVLLQEHISLIGAEKISSLKSIFVVDDDQVSQTINSILQTAGVSRSYSPNPNNPAKATAVPVENGETFSSFIVISKQHLQNLSLDSYHHSETVLALLEELLHVWVYTTTWQRRGFLLPSENERNGCENDIFIIASQMCDEYVVIRKKAELISTLPLIEVKTETAHVLTTGKIRYGGDIVQDITQSEIALEKTIIEAASGQMEIADAWRFILGIIYRKLFEPLSRNSAYCDAISENRLPDEPLRDINFYQELIADRWGKIHKGLKRVYNSDLDDTEIVLDEIIFEITSFLEEVGVKYRNLEENQCWVDFKSYFFDKWRRASAD